MLETVANAIPIQLIIYMEDPNIIIIPIFNNSIIVTGPLLLLK